MFLRLLIKKIINKIKTINNWYKNYYKKKPKICILGLNPHNAELRKIQKKLKIIIPAIKKLKKKMDKIDGPLSADTIFIKILKNLI